VLVCDFVLHTQICPCRLGSPYPLWLAADLAVLASFAFAALAFFFKFRITLLLWTIFFKQLVFGDLFRF
jgi:hypothetical protein